MTKALNDTAEQDIEIQQIISNNLSMLQQAFTEKFEQAKKENGISAYKDCEHLARYFLMGIYGLRTFAQTHPEPEVLKQLAEPEVLKQLAEQLYQDVLR